MTAQNKLGLLLALASTMLFGCEKSDSGQPDPDSRVTVTCVIEDPQVACEVTHDQGTRPVRACWDVRFPCANGKVIEAKNMCTNVPPAGLVRATQSLSGGSALAACDRALAGEIMGLKLTRP